jgi:hypothetical protein
MKYRWQAPARRIDTVIVTGVIGTSRDSRASYMMNATNALPSCTYMKIFRYTTSSMI